MHVLAGLPRSGSTLVCNILNQHPDVWASSTSALPNILLAMSQVMSSSPEVTADHANIPEALDRDVAAARAVVEAWYSYRPERVVVDKSRMWSHQTVMLRSILPDAAAVVMVRDPREVLASIERQHRATGLYQAQGEHLLGPRCRQLLDPEGMVGSAINGVENMIRSRFSNVLFVDHAALIAVPSVWMSKIETTLGIDAHDWDVDNVDNVSTDLDPLYRGKFPHSGEGAVSERSGHWSELIPEEIAKATIEMWPLYCGTFGYSS